MHLPTQETQETQVLFLGLGTPGGGNGNPLQYSCLENSVAEDSGGLLSMGSQKFIHRACTQIQRKQTLL